MKHFFRRLLWTSLSLFVSLSIVFGGVYLYLRTQLPSIEILRDIQLQTPLRVFSSDGKLIGEYGEMRRIPVAYEQIPQKFVEAILATEDRRFFEHSGVDFVGLTRASVQLIRTGTKSQGGSTITMQVARNFFLTKKKSFLRKINEIMLAMEIDRELSKEKVLELYLNQIYFGNRAYGVAAAAEVYYGKKLSELTLPEMAMLAGLPQAPSAHNPISNPVPAKKRRNHVLHRMLEEKVIDEVTYQKAIQTPLTEKYHDRKMEVEAPYVAEMVRQALYQQYGADIYTQGYKVYTTIVSTLQNKANQALEQGLLDYDKRHRYHGSAGHIEVTNLMALKKFPIIHQLYPAMITHFDKKQGIQAVSMINGSRHSVMIPMSAIAWRTTLTNFVPGDVIYVSEGPSNVWSLVEIPRVEGALVSLNTHNGAIVALDGGFDFYTNNFNHAAQAMRQAGSIFKPFIYSAALEKGFTWASIINDAPVVISEPGQPLWRPRNDERKFYGPTRLRIGLTKSRNLVSIRLLLAIGTAYALQYFERFGFLPAQLPQTLSLALGTLDATPLQMATAFAAFSNGGYKVNPYLIERVTDVNDRVLLQAESPTTASLSAIITPQNAYLMTSVLQDVMRTGTGAQASKLKRFDIAGKTGTSSSQKDAWFVGYNPDIVTAVWVGYSRLQLSLYEHGAQAALPIWIDFMQYALQGKPDVPFVKPVGIVSAQISPQTGLLVDPNQPGSITEVFQEGRMPSRSSSNDMSDAVNAMGIPTDSNTADPLF